MPVDASVYGGQVSDGSTAAVFRPKVELLNEVVHKVVAQLDQVFHRTSNISQTLRLLINEAGKDEGTAYLHCS